jgi:hypothetical protein
MGSKALGMGRRTRFDKPNEFCSRLLQNWTSSCSYENPIRVWTCRLAYELAATSDQGMTPIVDLQCAAARQLQRSDRADL